LVVANLVDVLLLVVVGDGGNTARDLVVDCIDAAASIAANELRVVRLPWVGVEGVIVLCMCRVMTGSLDCQ